MTKIQGIIVIILMGIVALNFLYIDYTVLNFVHSMSSSSNSIISDMPTDFPTDVPSGEQTGCPYVESEC